MKSLRRSIEIHNIENLYLGTLHMKIYKKLDLEEDEEEKLPLLEQKHTVPQLTSLMTLFAMQARLKPRHRKIEI